MVTETTYRCRSEARNQQG